MKKAEQRGKDEPLNVVKRMYEAFRQSDYQAFADLCAPNIEWVQCKGFPNSRKRIGSKAVIDHVFATNRKRWRDFGFSVDEMIVDGRVVVVIGSYTGCNHSTGERFTAAAAHVYEVVDGRIGRYRQYADTHVLRQQCA
ncbi:MAG: nuclear transport factor 2 family protein [Parvibaculaceae bacterium]